MAVPDSKLALRLDENDSPRSRIIAAHCDAITASPANHHFTVSVRIRELLAFLRQGASRAALRFSAMSRQIAVLRGDLATRVCSSMRTERDLAQHQRAEHGCHHLHAACGLQQERQLGA